MDNKYEFYQTVVQWAYQSTLALPSSLHIATCAIQVYTICSVLPVYLFSYICDCMMCNCITSADVDIAAKSQT
ncbi:hypothetical protein T10_6251 [Trichinella papuae]|uniref:Uncharacterized protein n=1 Tax=Trichinella papuae TaxID=268474 RepID=A0A0V1M3Q1_9BILA|nr:hypothetical protein T10_11039 [Trichinella papuae]KRZ80292.1 hypothetical protein T10_6251 [Trichinella papuae]